MDDWGYQDKIIDKKTKAVKYRQGIAIIELKFRSLLGNENGATAIEYGILAALIATAMSFIFGDSGIFY